VLGRGNRISVHIETMFDLLGYGGFFLLALCWIPQTIKTVREGRVSMQQSFLLMYSAGSALLMTQAIGLHNIPLILLNSYTTLASLINLYYGLFPRTTT
jgi:hypothetical protein